MKLNRLTLKIHRHLLSSLDFLKSLMGEVTASPDRKSQNFRHLQEKLTKIFTLSGIVQQLPALRTGAFESKQSLWTVSSLLQGTQDSSASPVILLSS